MVLLPRSPDSCWPWAPSRAGRVERAQAGIGGGDEVAVVQPHADVAGGGVHVAALEQAATDPADGLAGLVLFHGRAPVQSRAKALLKKSTAPKLPDLSVRCSPPSPATGEAAWHQGTPGSICGPICIWATSSA